MSRELWMSVVYEMPALVTSLSPAAIRLAVAINNYGIDLHDIFN